MPISVTGISTESRHRDLPRLVRGFSLLEILVVVAIIGIFVGVTVLSTDLVGFERRLEQEANRLASLISFASDEALLQTQDFGILVCDDSYHFFIYDYDSADWIPYLARPFEARFFDSDMLVALSIDDRQVELETAADAFPSTSTGVLADEELDEMPDPQIVILSSGEITPFQVEFMRESEPGDSGVLLNVAFDGQSEVTRSEI